MQLIRLVVTMAALVAVYFAQYIFQHQSLQDFFPQRLLDFFPSLYPITRWLPEDLQQIALWLSALAMVGVGLVAPTWPDGSILPATPAPSTAWRRTRLNTVALLVALLLATGLALYLALGRPEGLWLQVAWVGSILLYLFAARVHPSAEAQAVTPVASPPWRLLLLVLMVAGVLFNWPLRTVVPPLPDEIVTLGLQALKLTQGAAVRFFENSTTAFTGLTLLPWALVMRLSDDGLMAARIIGTTAALVTILATWLLGCELFRRSPMAGPYGEWVEDSGHWPALVAGALVGANVVVFHFSRLPIYMEPVAWGVLGLWVWLRSLRTGSRWGLALSGVLIGITTLLYQSGLLFLMLMPLWWLGARLLQPDWLRTARRSLLWWGGLWVTVAPLIGVWAHAPQLLLGRIQGVWLPDLARLSAAFNLPLDPTFASSQLSTGLGLLVAPLLVLAVGCLLLNLDRLTGWLLGSWFTVAVVLGGAMTSPTLLWPTLAPVLPVLALLVAFTLDRLRTTIVESTGAWMAQAITYLTIGLILWVGQASWVDYNRFVRTTITPDHYVGFALRRLDPQSQATSFIQADEEEPIWESPRVRFLVNDKFAAANIRRYTPTTLPETLPPKTVLIWQPTNGEDLLRTVQTRYPGGSLRTRRDQLANPIVHFYELP